MSNPYFQFRRFTVRQDRCAMKVGTDGVLLGAWANMPHASGRILDVGTGTGLVALMMAQRFPETSVVGVDIDEEAVSQARQNVAQSPFSDRIELLHADIREVSLSPFDAIVVNPPYFVDALTSPDAQRTTARHTDTLSYRDLMAVASRLLTEQGLLSVVIPFDYLARLESEAILAGFHKSRQTAVKTTPKKPPRRYLVEWTRHPSCLQVTEEVLETAPLERSAWYRSLTQEFYLK